MLCLIIKKFNKNYYNNNRVKWQSMYRCKCGNYFVCDKDSVNQGDTRSCERWLKFDNFLTDMDTRLEGTSLDRIDVNGNYEPGNCRWATAKEQINNRRKTS